MLSSATRVLRTRGASFTPVLRTSATLSVDKSNEATDLASFKRMEPADWFSSFSDPSIRAELNKLRDLESELIATANLKAAPVDWDAWEKDIAHPSLVKELKEIYASMPVPDVDAETARMQTVIDDTFKPIISELSEMASKSEAQTLALEKKMEEVTFLHDNVKDMPLDEFLDKYPSVKKSIEDDIANNKWFVEE